jgi:hypothetical protein
MNSSTKYVMESTDSEPGGGVGAASGIDLASGVEPAQGTENSISSISADTPSSGRVKRMSALEMMKQSYSVADADGDGTLHSSPHFSPVLLRVDMSVSESRIVLTTLVRQDGGE